jgi:hypothetical protein
MKKENNTQKYKISQRKIAFTKLSIIIAEALQKYSELAFNTEHYLKIGEAILKVNKILKTIEDITL